DGKSSKENFLQNEIDRPLEVSLTSEIRDCALLSVEKQKHELLKDELAKSSSDSKDIQANLLSRIKVLENDFKRSQAQSIDFELKLQHQKEVDELIEHVNQKTHAYTDVRAENQDLLMIISELKDKLRTNEKGKHVNTKFDKSKTSGTLLCVESSNSIRRPKYKGTKSNNRVLKNTNAKSLTAHVRKMSAHRHMFGRYHCVARYALSRNSNVKRALFTTPIATKSKSLGTTSVVVKSRLSVANTPKATTKVIQLILWIIDSGCSTHMTGNLQLLRNFVKKFMGTVRFRNDHFVAITGYGDYVQGNLTICHVYYVEGLEYNLFSVEQFLMEI
ncbi:hypothetical protein Tco_1027967, partial [Tanacetum coccineum]